MKAATLQSNTISDLSSVLEFVLENKYSDFYKKKYVVEKIEINSYEDFQKIPLLEKKELLETKLEDRIFDDKNNIVNYLFSSGTTGAPLISAHSTPFFPDPKDFFDPRYKQTLILMPLSITAASILALSKDFVAVPGDINNLPLTAQLLNQSSINSLATTPTILEFLIKELEKINFDLNRFKFIIVTGEACSEERLSAFKEKFSSARVVTVWGATELGGGLGYQCEPLTSLATNTFHLNHKFLFCEIINEQGLPAEIGEEGEIVMTMLFQGTSVLIRYRTGDLGTITKSDCPCGNPYTVRLLGRSEHRNLKFHGVIMHANMIEKSLNGVKEYIEPGFRMHIFEKEINGKKIPELEIHLILKDKNSEKENSFTERIRQSISANMRFSEKNTLSSLVEQKVFLPLQIKFVDEWPREAKAKLITPHF